MVHETWSRNGVGERTPGLIAQCGVWFSERCLLAPVTKSARGAPKRTPAGDLEPVGKSLVDTISASEPLTCRTVTGIAAESRTVTGRTADADEQARAIRHAPSIEILSATQFESLLAGTEISSAFALRIWQG